MKDERYQEIMKQIGMPDSQSLLDALRQVANEVAQERAEEGDFVPDVSDEEFARLVQTEEDLQKVMERLEAVTLMRTWPSLAVDNVSLTITMCPELLFDFLKVIGRGLDDALDKNEGTDY